MFNIFSILPWGKTSNVAECKTEKLKNQYEQFLQRFTNSSQVESDTAQKIITAPIHESTPKPEVVEPATIDPTTDSSINPLSPIQFDQYAKEFVQLSSLDTFNGFRLECAKTVTPQLQTNHSLFLATNLRDTGQLYQFGPTFTNKDASLVMMARYGNDGCLTTRFLKKFGPKIETRLCASSCLTLPQRTMLELAYDQSGFDWCVGGKLAWQGAWVTNFSFSQLIAPNLHLGSDFTWIGTSAATAGSIGARYAINSHVLSGTLSRQPNFKSMTGLLDNVHSLKLQYLRRVSNRLSLGTEFEVNHDPQKIESALRMGYEYNFRQTHIQGLVDFDGKASMTAQTTSGFGVSGSIDYKKSDYKFGFFMQIVPPPIQSDKPEISSV